MAIIRSDGILDSTYGCAYTSLLGPIRALFRARGRTIGAIQNPIASNIAIGLLVAREEA